MVITFCNTTNAQKTMSSDPSLTRSPLAILEHHQTPIFPLAAAAASGSGCISAPSPSSSVLSREYRKGNWTVQETLILITAKRLDDDRRSRGGATTSSDDPSTAPRSAEQRWKWVENYCWKQGCLRSQNQCNDKWDNLLRDYKKVRDYESRAAAAAAAAASPTSYWSLERHERKERNLPTNLAFEVYEALTDVLSRRATLRAGAGGSAAAPHPRPLPLPPPPPPRPPPPAQASVSGEMTPEGSSETEGCGGGGDGSQSPPSRGKRRRGLGPSVVRGAAELARALIACEERKERRHRDLMEMEERRLRMEENRTEMNRQAFAGLIAAVNGLSAAVHSLVPDHRGGHGR